MAHITTTFTNARVNHKYIGNDYESANLGLCYWPDSFGIEFVNYKRKKENGMAIDNWFGRGVMDMLYNPLATATLDKLGEKPKKDGVALSKLWATVEFIIGRVNKLIAQRKEDIKEVRTKAEYTQLIELSEKIDAIARALELEFQHKSEIKLNEYELVEPSEEEDDEDDYDY